MATQELAVESVLLSDLVEAAEHGTEVLLMKEGEPLDDFATTCERREMRAILDTHAFPVVQHGTTRA